MATEKDNQSKARIVSHMNADHHDSLVHLAQHFGRLSARQAYPVQMSGIDLSGLTLVNNAKNIRVPFNPPMASYSQARERIVELARVTRLYLSKDDVSVNDFVGPWRGPLGPLPFLVCVATFVGYSQRWWFAPGEIAEQFAGEGFAAFSWWVQPRLFWGMVAVHGAEAWLFARGRLEKHSVNPATWAYWLWVGSVFVEGFFATIRFDRFVKGKREAKAKAKH